MADTQRTKAALLSLFADNVTGQISAQDFRDFVATVMDLEFLNPGDFFKEPSVKYTTTDKTARGWIDYSQTVGSDVAWRDILCINSVGQWIRADVADSTLTPALGLAMDSYTSGTSTCQILRKGVVYDSALSAIFSGKIGRPVYLDSGVPGGISAGITTNSELIIGIIEPSDDGGNAIGKFRFDPVWAVRGN